MEAIELVYIGECFYIVTCAHNVKICYKPRPKHSGSKLYIRMIEGYRYIHFIIIINIQSIQKHCRTHKICMVHLDHIRVVVLLQFWSFNSCFLFLNFFSRTEATIVCFLISLENKSKYLGTSSWLTTSVSIRLGHSSRCC